MDKEPRKPPSDLIRYSTVGVQMVMIIGVFAFLGNFLDGKFQTERPLWTAFLSLFGVICAVVYLVVAANRMNKK